MAGYEEEEDCRLAAAWANNVKIGPRINGNFAGISSVANHQNAIYSRVVIALKSDYSTCVESIFSVQHLFAAIIHQVQIIAAN